MSDFDSRAAKWDTEPRRVILARAVADAIISQVKPDACRTLDFGSGTGLVTLALAPFSREIVAADTSSGMLEQLKLKLAEANIENVHPFLIQEDSNAVLPSGFDLIVSSMTMHHIADVTSQLQLFRKIIKTGGFLCIADLETEDGSFHDHPGGFPHNGFSASEMESYFSSAGFTNLKTSRVAVVRKERNGKICEYPVNLTTGSARD